MENQIQGNKEETSKVSQDPQNVEQQQQEKKKSYAEEFDAWLNESGTSSGYGSGDYYSLKEDGQHDVITFHHSIDNPPKHEPRPVPDIKDRSKKKMVEKVIFKLSRLEEPDRIRTWELAPKHAKIAWQDYIKKGITIVEVTRHGKSGDPQTSYTFAIYLTPEQRRLLLLQQPKQQ
jgi:hypothetical protein